jgi:sec-independent protein translocase protein TatA
MGLSVGHLLLILLVVILLFGTRRLATIGRDLGTALKGFREAVREPTKEDHQERVIEGKVEPKEKEKSSSS